MSTFLIGITAIVLSIVAYFVHKKISIRREEVYDGYFPMPNGKGKSIQLTRINGCGMSFIGKFRYSHVGGIPTYITYYTLFLLFVPIISFRAYRVADADGGGYHILGSEDGALAERGLIYLKVLSWALIIIGAVAVFYGIQDIV